MFKDIFKKEYESKYFSPGRINIIGEHIDYNGGYCLPMSIDKGTYGYIGKNNNNKFRVYSNNYKNDGLQEINISEEQQYDKKNGWTNIFRGMLQVMKKHWANFSFGIDLYIDGEIPTSSGLSSSASLSTLIGYILNDVYKLNLTTLDLVYLTQEMENKFLGAHTGILDQYAILNGRKKHALLLNTQVPSHAYFPLDFSNNVILIISTNVKRNLNESKYNERVSECQQGKQILNDNGFDIKDLCELNISQLTDAKKFVKDLTIYKRIEHCVTEQARVIKAIKALDNPKALGPILYEGHKSMRDLYEATGEHLDFIYEFAKTKKYVYGARMNGAGFGGSGITLLPITKVEEYKKEFAKAYIAKFNIEPTFMVANSGNGTHKC